MPDDPKQRILDAIDREAKPLTHGEWVRLLEDLLDNLNARMEAAMEEGED